MLDTALFVYNGIHLNGSLLQLLEVDQVSFENDQLGGFGKGTFRTRYAFEESSTLGSQYTLNLNVPNRVECYLRNDLITTQANSGAYSISVANPGRFATGKSVMVWDGVNYDVALITNISGSTLTLGTALGHTYAANTNVLVLRYTGFISAVQRDTNLENFTIIETTGYQSQWNQFYTTANGGGYECGWFLYYLFSSYSGVWDLTASTSNFVMTSTGSLSGGTGQPYNGSQTNASVMSIVQDVLNFANSNTTDVTYNCWVDEFNAIHFGVVQDTTVTVSVNLKNPTPGVTADGIFNNVNSYQLRDQDLQSLCNEVLVTGGNDGNGNPITAIVADQTSINLYGTFQNTISNTGLYTEQDAADWGQAYLNLNAFPRQSGTLVLDVSGNFATAQDYIEIAGFTDGSTVESNVQSVTTTWSAGDLQFAQQLKLQQNYPNITKLLNQAAQQHYIAAAALADGGTNVHDRFVISGLTPTVSGSAFMVSSGSLGCLVAPSGLDVFSLPALTYRPYGDGVSTLGWLYREVDGTIYGGESAAINVYGPASNNWTVGTSTITVTASASYTLNFQYNSAVTGHAPAIYVIDGTHGYGESYYAATLSTATNGVANYAASFTPLSSSVQVVFQANGNTINAGAFSVTNVYLKTGSTITKLLAPGVNQFTIANGSTTNLFISTAPQWVAFPGTTVPVANSFYNSQFVPLFTVYRYGGVVVDYDDKRQYGSINTANLAANTYSAPTYTGLSAVTNAATAGVSSRVLLSLTLNNVPQDYGCSGLQWYMRIHGSSNWAPFAETQLTPYPLPSASQAVSLEYGDLTNGTGYDFGIAYLNLNGQVNAGASGIATLESNYVVNSMAITAPYMLNGTAIAPTISGTVTPTAITSVNGISAGATMTFTITNQPTNGSLSRISFYYAIYVGGTLQSYTFYESIPAVGVGQSSPPSSGTYTVSPTDLSNGQTYAFAIAFEDVQGGESSLTQIVSSYAAQSVVLPNSSLQHMPSAIQTNGPNVTITAATLSGQNGGSDEITITYNINDTITGGWYAKTNFHYRIHGTTNISTAQPANQAGLTSGVVSVVGGLGAGKTYDIGLGYEDISSQESTIVWPSALSGILAEAVGSIGIASPSNTNLVVDSNFDYSGGSWPSTNMTYWGLYGVNAATNEFIKGQGTDNVGSENVYIIRHGANSVTYTYTKNPINVIAGSPMVLSVYCDCTYVTNVGSGVFAQACSASTGGTVYATVSQSAGSHGVISMAFTVPSGVTQMYVRFGQNGATITSTGSIFYNRPQLEYGSVLTAYKPGANVVNSTGTMDHATHSLETQATVSTTAGSDGSYLTAGVVSRRHIQNANAGNLVFNPTAAQNTNGWATYDSTGHAGFGRDANWGGRFYLSIPQTTLSGTDALYQQTVTVVANTTYIASGNIYGTSIPSGGFVCLDVEGVGTSTVLATSTQLTTGSVTITPVQFTFNSGTNTSVLFRLRANSGTTTPSVGIFCAFSALRIEPSLNNATGASVYLDDYAAGLVSTTHQATAGTTDGSYLYPGIISARHMYGGLSTDQGALVDSSSRILYARHAPAIQGVISSGGALSVNPSGGVTGDLPFANHDSAIQSTFTRASSTQLTTAASTLVIPQGSLIPVSTSFSAVVTPSSSATAYTTVGGSSVYSQINVTWPAWSVTYPNGVTVNCGSFAGVNLYATGFNSSGTGIQPSTSYYLSFFYLYNSGTAGTVYTGIFSSATLTQSQAATFFADNAVTLFLNQGPVTTPAKPGSGTTGGTGYNPPGNTCPGENQVLETRRGFIPAKELRVGDYLRDWDGERWNRVNWLNARYGEMFRVKMGRDLFEVDKNHLFWSRLGWWPVHSLQRGDTVLSAESYRDISVDAIERLGIGRYIEIKCDNQRFRMGEGLSHNVYTGI